jgi:hypothetical protein
MGRTSDTVLLSLGAALAGVVGEAASTGLLVPNARAHVLQPPAKRPDDEREPMDLLVLPSRDEHPMMIAAHRSHRSHSSHRSHYSGRGGGYSYSGYADAPAPPRPKPATVSFVAYPGGRIFVDTKLVGVDESRLLTLPAGEHTVRIENRFVGDTTVVVKLTEGQTGIVEVKW